MFLGLQFVGNMKSPASLGPGLRQSASPDLDPAEAGPRELDHEAEVGEDVASAVGELDDVVGLQAAGV